MIEALNICFLLQATTRCDAWDMYSNPHILLFPPHTLSWRPCTGVSLLMLLHLLQQITAPLVTGILMGPTVFITNCNICYAIQALFPWPVRSQQLAPRIHSGRCLSGHTRALVHVFLKFSCWFNVLQMIAVKKSFNCRYLIDNTIDKRCTGAPLASALLGLSGSYTIILSSPPWVPWMAPRTLSFMGWAGAAGCQLGLVGTSIVTLLLYAQFEMYYMECMWY